jgi:hypothetical protein
MHASHSRSVALTGALLLGSALLGACARDEAPAAAPPATAALPAPPSAPAAGKVQRFGAALSSAQPVELDTVLGDPEKYQGAVKLKGQVTQVCTRKGCWMALKGQKQDQTVRVRFKDYGFFVPTGTTAGTLATCEGELRVKNIDEATARHYASETKGVSPEQVLAIKGPQRELSFIASGVELSKN